MPVLSDNRKWETDYKVSDWTEPTPIPQLRWFNGGQLLKERDGYGLMTEAEVEVWLASLPERRVTPSEADEIGLPYVVRDGYACDPLTLKRWGIV